jgi:serine/threonine-protein kinase
MTPPPPKRRLALVLAVLALLAAAGGIYAVVNRPGEKAEAHQPSTTHPATRFYSSSGPAAEAPTVKPTTAPASSPAPSPTPKLTFEDAMSRLRTAVEDGAAGGEIRGDVATDLLNLIRNLERADTKDVDTQVSQLRRKITERTGEGGLSAKRAAILRARVTDLERAAGM